jgi:hypothetical protein
MNSKAQKSDLFTDSKAQKANLFTDSKAQKADLFTDSKAQKADSFTDSKAQKADLFTDSKAQKADLFIYILISTAKPEHMFLSHFRSLSLGYLAFEFQNFVLKLCMVFRYLVGLMRVAIGSFQGLYPPCNSTKPEQICIYIHACVCICESIVWKCVSLGVP